MVDNMKNQLKKFLQNIILMFLITLLSGYSILLIQKMGLPYIHSARDSHIETFYSIIILNTIYLGWSYFLVIAIYRSIIKNKGLKFLKRLAIATSLFLVWLFIYWWIHKEWNSVLTYGVSYIPCIIFLSFIRK